jgi:hypothetical protein
MTGGLQAVNPNESGLWCAVGIGRERDLPQHA